MDNITLSTKAFAFQLDVVVFCLSYDFMILKDKSYNKHLEMKSIKKKKKRFYFKNNKYICLFFMLIIYLRLEDLNGGR